MIEMLILILLPLIPEVQAAQYRAKNFISHPHHCEGLKKVLKPRHNPGLSYV
jgi:hypothetical protein